MRGGEPRGADIAALYARIRVIEEEQNQARSTTIEQLTAFGQEVDRNSSYSRSTESFFKLKLAEVEERTQQQVSGLESRLQLAEEGVTSNQDRMGEIVDRMADISSAMQGITRSNANNTTVMEGLVRRMEQLPTMVSNEVETWGSIRFGPNVREQGSVATSRLGSGPWMPWYDTAAPSSTAPTLNPPRPTLPQEGEPSSSLPSSQVSVNLRAMWKEVMESGSDSGGDPVIDSALEAIRNTITANAMGADTVTTDPIVDKVLEAIQKSTSTETERGDISPDVADEQPMDIDVRDEVVQQPRLSPLAEEDEIPHNPQPMESNMPFSSPPPDPTVIPPTPGGSTMLSDDNQGQPIESAEASIPFATPNEETTASTCPPLPSPSSSDTRYRPTTSILPASSTELLHPAILISESQTDVLLGPMTRSRARSQTPQPTADARARSYTPQPVADRPTRPRTRARSSSATIKGSTKPRSRRG